MVVRLATASALPSGSKLFRKEVNCMGQNQHVVPHDGKWAVRGEGNQRVSSLHDTQSEAIAAARNTAILNRSEVVIHGGDGQIRDKDSYGNDPFPPRDKRH